MMNDIRRTTVFDVWLEGLKDDQARARIQMRIDRMEDGNWGDHKRFDGLIELRIHYGPGYRLYCVERGNICIILLAGGTKSSQPRDIKRARDMALTV